MVGAVEPTPPEPIKVYSGSVFHRAEKVGWSWPFELPPYGILFEGEIKEFSTHDRFTQDVQRGGRFRISVGSEL